MGREEEEEEEKKNLADSFRKKKYIGKESFCHIRADIFIRYV